MDRTPVSGRGASSNTDQGPTPVRATGPSDARNFDDAPHVSGGVASRSQRESPRRAPPCNALVRNGSAYVIADVIHDMSLSGLSVELDSAGMTIGDPVEVMLEFSDSRGTINLQLSAEVVRVDPRGVGLRFCAYGDQTYTDLVNLIYTR